MIANVHGPSLLRGHDGQTGRRHGWIAYLRWADWPYFLCLTLTVYPAMALVAWGAEDDGVAVQFFAVSVALVAATYWLRRVRRVALARAVRDEGTRPSAS